MSDTRDLKTGQWRGLSELEGRPDGFMDGHNEFPPGSAEPPGIPADLVSRRRFLALMGASAALAATAGCSRVDRGTVVPYTKKPEDVVPGVADYYATTVQEGLTPYGVLVKTREGRPIHIEGNDEHPHYAGKTSPRVIADVLRLYDPDRLRQPLVDGRPATWNAALARVLPAFKEAASGKQVLLLTGAVISPTTLTLIAALKERLPGLSHVQWEPARCDSQEATLRSCFGETLRAKPRLDRARVIVSFDSDFLSGENPEAVRQFADKRKPGNPREPMNRLWVFEGGFSLTGSKADHRIPLRPSRASATVFALAGILVSRHGLRLPEGLAPGTLSAFEAAKVASVAGVPIHFLETAAADLASAGREALVLAGPELPAEAQIACHLLNVILGAEGYTVDSAYSVQGPALSTLADILKVTQAMASGAYAAAVIWGVNTSYAHPDPRAWESALAKVPLRVRLGLFEDETAKACQVILPESHWLESWGDYESSTDLLSLQQPASGRLYETRQGEEVLLALLKGMHALVARDYVSFLKERWRNEVYPAGSAVPFETYWNAALHDGVVRRQATRRLKRELNPEGVAEAAKVAGRNLQRTSSQGFELLLKPDAKIFDGRYANSGWLQELPDPITKLTWGNALGLSVSDALKMGLGDGSVAKLEAGGRSVQVPIIVQPGQAQGVLTLALGYGRSALSVASGVGVNAYPLLAADGSSPFLREGVKLEPSGEKVSLATTQMHFRMEGRDLVRSWNLMEYAEKAKEPPNESKPATLYPEQKFPLHKWGMTIDLSACVGCGGCVLACQSENNIPVVGPEQVARGRAMHWIRVDRYYEGEPEAPRALSQVMLCQQCDDAPCENVCPVNATTHSSEGLNQMVYNRCVGTRYCANNCPYKVRRFNYFEFNAQKKPPESLVFNPEVSVRPRGVMEKCTFCVQRIEDAKIRAKVEGRRLKDGEITPACAAACPAEAIVFGDLDDPESRVSGLSKSGRGFKVLEELGVRPSVTYLAELKNPVKKND